MNRSDLVAVEAVERPQVLRISFSGISKPSTSFELGSVTRTRS
jgi:hypothetical protein